MLKLRKLFVFLPETAWWRWRPARRPMLQNPFFWVFSMNRLVVVWCLPSDTN